jgi:membrane-associated phospholipid phosphatase
MRARALPLSRRKICPLTVGALAGAWLAAAPETARATEAPPVQTEAARPGRARVEWSPRWPRFRAWEYGGTAVLGAASLYLYRYQPPPAEAKWQGENAFDDAFRGWLRADTREGRELAGTVSDVLWLGGSAVPYVVDLPVILLAHREPRVAWQVLMMDLEANAVAGFINNALFYEVGRGRPSYRSCAADPGYDQLCGSTGNNAAFPSGHTLGIATAAGLTCVHHHYLPLYGHPAADGGACALMSVATVVTAATRVVADRHYASDSIAGAAIGFAAGYGLPWLLHYRSGLGAAAFAGAAGPVVVPFASADVLGVGLFGAL